MFPALLLACAEPSGWEDLQASVDAVARQNGDRGGVLMQVRDLDGELLWSGAAGLAHEDGPAMEPDFTFEIASITKSFTAITTLMLVEEGSLTLDGPLRTWLDAELTAGLLVVDGHDFGPELTPRQLLAHESGLPDYWTDPPYVRGEQNAFLRDFLADEDRLWEGRELIDYARALDPIGAPGEAWHYSDTNYVLLGLLIEAVEGEPLEQVFARRLYEPLGMDVTYMRHHEDPASNLEESHRYEGREDLFDNTNQSADWAGGGLVSDGEDLSALWTALAADTLFADPATREAMFEFVPTDWGEDVDYGLGLIRVRLDGDYGALWGHEGHGGSFAYVWPERELLLLGTVNQTDADPWDLLVDALER